MAMDPALKNLIRVGRVTKHHPDPSKRLVRVLFEDKSETESYWLSVIKNPDSWIPSKDSLVLCLYMPSGSAQGFVLGEV